MLDPLTAIIATALSLALIQFPEVIFRWAVRRRRLSLGSLLTLPLMTTVLPIAYRLAPIYVFKNFTMMEFLLALVGLTVLGSFIVAFFRQLGSSLVGGSWWTFGFTLGIPVALVLLSFWLANAKVDSSLHGPWDNLHRLALAAIVLTGFLIVIWWFARLIGSGLRRVMGFDRVHQPDSCGHPR
jgi:hypothetical protein